MELQDIEIICQCGNTFIWTEGEQFFMNKLLEEGKIDEVVQPKRCKSCRAKKKELIEKRSHGADV